MLLRGSQPRQNDLYVVRCNILPMLTRYCYWLIIQVKISLMMTTMMMMNCLCGMVDQRKTFSLISSHKDCQISSPLWISNTPQAGFEPAQNLNSGFVEWSCAVVITTTPQRVTNSDNHYTILALDMRLRNLVCFY